MRIHRIEITGFGPFRDRQVVDLDDYASEGLFLIAGRTGAGKSSILDAISYALFGAVTRYDGGEPRLRSDHCAPNDPTLVAIEFTVNEVRWRMERSPQYERPKHKGDGSTLERARVRFGRVGDEVEWIATKEVEVAALVQQHVGLTRQQFLQVILLAQGRFATFLLADSRERQAVLRSLFGTRRYERLEELFAQRRQEAEKDAAQGLADLDALFGAHEDGQDASGTVDGRRARMAEGLAGLVDQHAHADAAVRAATNARDAAEAELRRRREVDELQRRRRTARADAATLDADVETHRHREAELAAARTAERVRDVLDEADAAEHARVSCDRAVEMANEVWNGSERTPDDLDAWAEAARERIGGWEPIRLLGDTLPVREKALTEARDELAVTVSELAAQTAARAALPERRAALDTERQELQDRATSLSLATERVERARARHAAAVEAATLAERCRAAVAAADAASAARTSADHRLAELHRARLDGYAGELATGLVAGEPCPVCGSTVHPHPAPPSATPVGAADLDAAEATRAEAVAADDRAAEARRIAESALREAEARADGQRPETAEAAVTEAVAAQAEASAAAERLLAVEAARAALEGEDRALAEVITRLTADVAARRTTLSAEEERLALDRTAVDEARGEAVDLATRIAAERAQADAAIALANALRAQRDATVRQLDAAKRRDQRLTDVGFATPDEARAALRSPAALDALDTAIRRVHDERVRIEAVLAEVAANEPGEEPVDVAAALAAATESTRKRDEALAELTVLAERRAARETALARVDEGIQRHRAALTRAEEIAGVAAAIAGQNLRRMDLETFVLAAELEVIVEAANRRLDRMSSGRYRLLYSDQLAYRKGASGLGLEVLDTYTGRTRSPRSLSGGETFYAALSLALGLAEVVTRRTGGVTLDTLFIDEGFGSLDAETLQTAMGVLDALREGGRTVGVISHVDAMKEQIPAQLRVERSQTGISRVVVSPTGP